MPSKYLPKAKPEIEEKPSLFLNDPEYIKQVTQLIGLLLLKVSAEFIRDHRDIMDELVSDSSKSDQEAVKNV